MTQFKLLAHKGFQSGAGVISLYSNLASAEQRKRTLIEQEGYGEADISIFPCEVEGAVEVA
jgi:hypothetical protein